MPEVKRLAAWEDKITALFTASGEVGPNLQVRCYEILPTTMDQAREVFSGIDIDSLGIVCSRSQTAGRGRRGRQWESVGGSLAVTYALRSSMGTAALVGLSLAVGCAVARVLEKHCLDVRLKWPNDIMSPTGSKLGGILIEIVGAQSGISEPLILIGIGLNLHDAPQLQGPAASIYEISGKKLDAPSLAAEIGQQFWAVWHDFRIGGFANFKDEWWARCSQVGEGVSIDAGSRVEHGIVCGVGDQGELLLDKGGEIVRICSGQVC